MVREQQYEFCWPAESDRTSLLRRRLNCATALISRLVVNFHPIVELSNAAIVVVALNCRRRILTLTPMKGGRYCFLKNRAPYRRASRQNQMISVRSGRSIWFAGSQEGWQVFAVVVANYPRLSEKLVSLLSFVSLTNCS